MKSFGTQSYVATYVGDQLRATKALVKFCDDHHNETASLADIRLCQESLEDSDIEAAAEYYLRVPLGGNGCFNDWWPPVVFEHETEDYVSAVFEALVTQWSLMMKLSSPKV